MGFYAGKGGPRGGPFYSGFSFKTGPYVGYRGPKLGGVYTGYRVSSNGRRSSVSPANNEPLGRLGRALVVVCMTPFLWCMFFFLLGAIAFGGLNHVAADGVTQVDTGVTVDFWVASALATIYLIIGMWRVLNVPLRVPRSSKPTGDLLHADSVQFLPATSNFAPPSLNTAPRDSAPVQPIQRLEDTANVGPRRLAGEAIPRKMPVGAVALGEFRCVGACHRVLPIQKFPTEGGKPGGSHRLAECRDCRNAREKGRGGSGAPPPWVR